MKIERLETERLILRTYEERDLQDLYEYLSDEEVVAFEPYEPMNPEEVKKCLEDRIVSEEFLAIEEKCTGKMIGNIYVSERYAESVEIGYVLNRKFWKKGYAYEACDRVCKYIFEQGKHRIEAACDPLNVASWKLLERLGFQREGYLHKDIYFRKDEDGNPIWKDTYIYSLLCEPEHIDDSKIKALEIQMWEAARNRDKEAFLNVVSEGAVMICGGYRCTGAEYAQITEEFDCKAFCISEYEVVAENSEFIQVHYMITTTVNDEANKDLAGTYHISTTWKRFGDVFKVVFNMDSLTHIS